MNSENFCIQEHAFIFFIHYPLFMVWMLGQHIGFILGTRFVNDGKHESGEEQHPSGLSPCELLLGGKVDQIPMV